MSSTHYDVIVIGAGPAGNTAAIECTRGGKKVALIEKVDHPRVKVCGGGLVKRAFDACPINVESTIKQTINEIDLVWHRSNVTLTDKQTDPIVYMVERKTFDKHLFDAALQEGVDYYPKTQVKDIRQDDSAVYLKANNLSLSCDWLIGADGASGKTAALAGWPKVKTVQVPALDAEVILKEPLASALNRTRFDFETIKEGYGWVFPKGNHFSIGVGRFKPKNKSKAKSLQEELNQYLEILGITSKDIVSIKRYGFVIPLRYIKEGASKGRVLLVGDAAGLADPLTAEGLSAAILSAKIAANSICCPKQDQTAAQSYQNHLDREFLIDLQISERLSHLLYKYPRLSKLLMLSNKKRAVAAISSIFTGKRRFSELQFKGSLFKRVVFKLFLNRSFGS